MGSGIQGVFTGRVQKFGRTVLASIHDAIVIRERLSQYELEVIVHGMRSITHNRYWSLTGRELKAYE